MTEAFYIEYKLSFSYDGLSVENALKSFIEITDEKEMKVANEQTKAYSEYLKYMSDMQDASSY